MLKTVIYLVFLCLSLGLWASDRAALQAELEAYAKTKDARIGIAVIFDGTDTVQVNGGGDFPMLSVYKFPIAVALAESLRRTHYDLDDYYVISADDLKADTWSPMREKIGRCDTTSLTIGRVLEYSLAYSDNNASDIILGNIGGACVADSIIKSLGYKDIHICSTEDDMHRDVYLCYQNRATPLEMAQFCHDFFGGDLCRRSHIKPFLINTLMGCKTGVNRLAKPLPHDAILYHKTGTGDRNAQGRIIGVNDVGYVTLPNGHNYAIAVFVADSAYDLATTEQFIADISSIILHHTIIK